MSRLKRIGITALFVLTVLITGTAQNSAPAQNSSPTITASASGDRVRITAPDWVVQMRLEVYNSTGKKLFDNEVRGGNIMDWHLQDGQAEQLKDDTYLCLITVKSVSGKLSQKAGAVIVEKSSATVLPAQASQFTDAQSQAIGPIEENASITVLNDDDNRTATIISHNGKEGQITRGRGDLTFRIGDLFNGKDTEQMRLTAEGNFGIGITHPLARLDVDGLIRATQGIVFPDGSVQFSASSRVFGSASQRPGQFGKNSSSGREHIDAAGTGTIDHIAKWSETGGAGTLTDSAIVDVNGDIGIGTTSPQSGLDYRNGFAAFFTRDIPTNPGNAISALQLGLSNVGSRNVGVGPSFLFFGENSAGAKSFLGRVSAVWESPTAGSEAGGIFFQVRANSADVNALTERMRITSSGNVGIGTTNPTYKLHISDPISGLRVEESLHSGILASFGGNGAFMIDSHTVQGGRFTVMETGAVGIGTNNPTAALHVNGNAIITSDVTLNGLVHMAPSNGSNIFLGATGCPTGFAAIGFGSFLSCTNYALSSNGTDLFINRPTGGAIAFGENNSTQMYIESGGNAQIYGGFQVGGASLQHQFKLHVIDDSNAGLRVQTNTTGGTVASFASNGAFQIDAPGVPGGRLAVLQNGNVGIGINAPADVLQVVGSGTAIRATDGSVNTRLFSSSSTNNGYVGTSGANGFVLRTNNTDRVTIDANGNVGIGTTAPLDRLHVDGSIRATNGGIFIAHPNSLIITSPNSSCWQIRVSDTGTLFAGSVTCP